MPFSEMPETGLHGGGHKGLTWLCSRVGVCLVGGSPMNECPGSALFSFLWEQCSLIQLDLLVGVQVRVALSM